MEATANKDVAVIDQQKDLAHLNALVTEITDLKESYKDLKIEGPEDKDGYEKVRLAIGVLRPKRTGLDRERKDVVRPYNEVVKFINGKYDEITTLIQEGPGGELELKAKKDAVDDIIEKQKEAERLAAEKKINDRINELISKGMVFSGDYYSIGDASLNIPETSIGIVDIRTMSDDLYSNFLQMVEDKSAKINAEKERVAELERKEKAEKEEKERLEREEFDRKKKLLDEQEERMKQQQQQMKEQQDKIDQQKREAEQREQQAQQEKINNIIRNRSAVLTGMGLEFNAQNDSFDYSGEVLVADAPGIAEYNDADWLILIETLKTTIAQKKKDAEEFLQKQKEEEQKKMQQQEQERLAGLSDKQRMQEYMDALLAIPVPEMKTKPYKVKAAMVRDFLTDNRPA